MKLAIIGSRGFDNYQLLKDTLNRYFSYTTYRADLYGRTDVHYHFDEVISGGAKGADFLAAKWVKEDTGCMRGQTMYPSIKLTEFLPDWEKHGKRAGFLRNEDIVKTADMVLAFWDGQSKGTGNSLSVAKRLKKPTLIIYFR